MNTYVYNTIANETGQIIISRSDGASIPKDLANSDYLQYLEDVTQSVADQSETTAIATAKTQAQAQADSEAKAKAAFTTQLAATNAKLMALGLTAQDISTLLNAAKG